MRIILEFDGVVANQQAAWHAGHVEAAGAVGWSRLDSATFWRLVRTKGRQADLLPAARPTKLAEYWTKFDQLVESEKYLGMQNVVDNCLASLNGLIRHAELVLVTLGENMEARRRWTTQHGVAGFFKEFHRLDADPRRRPVELKTLAKADRRTMVVAASDALIRSGGAAEIVSIGISTGTCTGTRLHQAGASVVYSDLGGLVHSLEEGAKDLIQAGLLPRSLDAPPQSWQR